MVYPETSPYRAPAWLPGGHVQTIYAGLFDRAPPIAYRRERMELPDGDFLDFDWVDAPPGFQRALHVPQGDSDPLRAQARERSYAPQGDSDFLRAQARERSYAPVVVLFHGLEGSSSSHYARTLMAAVQGRGWSGVVAHFRGCSGEDNRLPRAYYAGDSEDVERMLRRIRAHHPNAPLYAVGVSLGGNALLKWLGEQGDAASSLVDAAAGISAPLDLTAAGQALDRGFNRRFYTARFLRTLKAKALRKAARFPGILDARAIAAATTFSEFDTLVTARLHGFRDAEDYWRRVSSKPYLKSVHIPTLVLNAINDPFLPAWALPKAIDVAPTVILEQPASGGHVAFPSGPFPGNLDWLPRRLMQHFGPGR